MSTNRTVCAAIPCAPAHWGAPLQRALRSAAQQTHRVDSVVVTLSLLKVDKRDRAERCAEKQRELSLWWASAQTTPPPTSLAARLVRGIGLAAPAPSEGVVNATLEKIISLRASIEWNYLTDFNSSMGHTLYTYPESPTASRHLESFPQGLRSMPPRAPAGRGAGSDDVIAPFRDPYNPPCSVCHLISEHPTRAPPSV